MRHFTIAAICAFAAYSARPSLASATVLDFENYSEGQIWYGPFTDPTTGVAFGDNLDTGRYSIDYVDDWTGHPASHYLTGGSVALGPAAGAYDFFNFTATLPAPATSLSLDVIYAPLQTGRSFTLNGFDTGGNLVASTTYSADTSATQGTMLLTAPTGTRIRSFQFSHSPYLTAGIDNITYTTAAIPSPAARYSSYTDLFLATAEHLATEDFERLPINPVAAAPIGNRLDSTTVVWDALTGLVDREISITTPYTLNWNSAGQNTAQGTTPTRSISPAGPSSSEELTVDFTLPVSGFGLNLYTFDPAARLTLTIFAADDITVLDQFNNIDPSADPYFGYTNLGDIGSVRIDSGQAPAVPGFFAIDNVSFALAPEPTDIFLALGAAPLLTKRRRHR